MSAFTSWSITTRIVVIALAVAAIVGGCVARDAMLRRDGADSVTTELQTYDAHTLKNKADRDAKIRTLDDSALTDRLLAD